MKLHFTLLIVFFSAISLFAQPQKGDLFFGQSNSQLNHISEGGTTFSFSPTFGTFITNKIMVGGNLDFSVDRNNFAPRVGLFVNKYFGKKESIQGLAGFRVSRQSALSRSYFQSSLQVGAAWFPSSNSSLNLTYNINLQDRRSFLPNSLNPDIGLSMYFFLRKNQEAAEKPNARQSTNAGTKRLSLFGNFFTPRKIVFLTLNGGGRYFLKDNLYLQAEFAYFGIHNNPLLPVHIELKPQIGAGYYLSFSEQVALKVEALFSLTLNEKRSTSLFNPNAAGMNTRNTSFSGGFALFLGRHRIEPTIGILFQGISATDNRAKPINNSRAQVKIDYEYFLSQNVSVTGLISVLQKDRRYFLFGNSSSNEPTFDYEFSEYIFDRYAFDIGFNYYLTR